MKKNILIVLFLLIIPIYSYFDYKDFLNIKTKKSKTIEIISWDNILSSLKRELNYEELYLKIYIKLNKKNLDFNLEKWIYSIPYWSNIDDIIKVLKSWSITPSKDITILPWWNIYDIDNYLTNLSLIKKWEFIQEAQSINNYKADFSFLTNQLSLEWYLYPDTYSINPTNFDIEILIKKLLKNFESKITKNQITNYTDLDKIINIASIVEKEEKNSQEKPKVAWILIKRLEENWMLWADATACYSYKLTQEDCKMQLSNYIYQKNDYNTRTMTWLPKTPISNPSIDTIISVINYTKTPYYYYLHDIKTWHIYYAKTLEEHNINKRKYIK